MKGETLKSSENFLKGQSIGFSRSLSIDKFKCTFFMDIMNNNKDVLVQVVLPKLHTNNLQEIILKKDHCKVSGYQCEFIFEAPGGNLGSL